MSGRPNSGPTRHFSFRQDGFQPLHDSNDNMAPRDATIDIPLEQVQTNQSQNNRSLRSFKLGTGSTARKEQLASDTPVVNEKGGLFHGRSRHGKRKSRAVNNPRAGEVGYDGEEDTITRMGRFYSAVLNFSVVTRYFIYVLPLALLLAIPIIVGATAAQNAKIGGVRIVWFFTWIEIGKLRLRRCNLVPLTPSSMAQSMGLQDRRPFPPKGLPISRRCR